MTEKQENTNMKLWNAVCKTDAEYTSNFKGKGGFQGTAIAAQYQIMEATELWGPMGYKWGLENENYFIEKRSEFDSRYDVLIFSANLFYPHDGNKVSISLETEIDLWNFSAKFKSWSKNNDTRKKSRTDLLTKSLSQLGFNADIFMGKFDDNGYVKLINNEKQQKERYSILYSLERKFDEKEDDRDAAYKEYANMQPSEIEESIEFFERVERKDNAITYVSKLFEKQKKAKSVIDGAMYPLDTKEGLREILKSVSKKYGVIDDITKMFTDRVEELEKAPIKTNVESK